MKPYRFLEPARQELFEVSERYETQAAGLGQEFLAVVTATITLLRQHPDLGAPHRAGTRRLVLPRFPYGLVYLNEPDALVLVAIAHHRQAPEYWTGHI